MPTFIEKKLALDFPDDWEVTKYDRKADADTGETAGFYRRIIERGGVTHVRGMDFICRLPSSPPRLQFIEVKDERLRELPDDEKLRETAKKLRHSELFTTLLLKTTGTLAGLLLAERLADDSLHIWACLSSHPAVDVVLFLVEPSTTAILEEQAKFPLYRLAKKEGKLTLEQRLTAKFNQWGLPFKLYNLTNRLPIPWQVRDLS